MSYRFLLMLLPFGLALPAGAAPTASLPTPQTVEPASLKTYSALQVTEEVAYPDATGKHIFHHKVRVLAARVNRYRIETLMTPGDAYAGSVTVCDGKMVTVYNSKTGAVSYTPFRLHAGYGADEEITEGYFPVKTQGALLDGHATLYAGLDGSAADKSPIRMEWWFDAQTHLPRRHIDYRTLGGRLSKVYRKDYSNWLVDPPLPPSAFTFTPPTGAKDMSPHP